MTATVDFGALEGEVIDPEPTRDLTCEVCGEGLSYGGRGRKPRFCGQHKPNRTSDTPRKRPAQLELLRKELEQSFAGLGVMLCMVNMFDGQVVMSRSEHVSNSLIALAEKDPKIRRALIAAMSAQSYLQLAFAVSTIAVPIAWNHGMFKGIPNEATGKSERNPDLAPAMFKLAGLGAARAGENE